MSYVLGMGVGREERRREGKREESSEDRKRGEGMVERKVEMRKRETRV